MCTGEDCTVEGLIDAAALAQQEANPRESSDEEEQEWEPQQEAETDEEVTPQMPAENEAKKRKVL